MRLLYTLWGIVFFALCCNCTHKVDIEVEPHTPKLVAASWMRPNQPFSLILSQSASVKDSIIYLKSNEAFVACDGTQTKLSPKGRYGQHVSDLWVQEGKAYSINIKYPGYDAILATDTVPYAVPFKIKNFVQDGGLDEWGARETTLQVEFNDPPEHTNFYELKIVPRGEFATFWGIYTNDEFIYLEEPQSYENKSISFSDKSFNGETKTINVRMSYNEPDVDYMVYFKTVSQAYYQYTRTFFYQFETYAYHDIWVGTADRAPVYSNIENGYGILASFTVNVDSIIQSEYSKE